MASYPSGGRRKGPARANYKAIAANLSDELLVIDIHQLWANATSLPVGGRRPAFYGLPQVAAKDARILPIYKAEAKRRGLTIADECLTSTCGNAVEEGHGVCAKCRAEVARRLASQGVS